MMTTVLAGADLIAGSITIVVIVVLTFIICYGIYRLVGGATTGHPASSYHNSPFPHFRFTTGQWDHWEIPRGEPSSVRPGQVGHFGGVDVYLDRCPCDTASIVRPGVPQLAAVQAVILDALRERWGPDNADPYEDDPTTLGVTLLDGSFVEITLHLCTPDGSKRTPT